MMHLLSAGTQEAALDVDDPRGSELTAAVTQTDGGNVNVQVKHKHETDTKSIVHKFLTTFGIFKQFDLKPANLQTFSATFSSLTF